MPVIPGAGHKVREPGIHPDIPLPIARAEVMDSGFARFTRAPE